MGFHVTFIILSYTLPRLKTVWFPQRKKRRFLRMSQQKQNTANQLLTLPSTNNGADLSMPGSTVRTPRPWWRRRIGIVVIALVLLAALAAGLLYMLFGQQPPPSYQYAPVTQGDL